MKKHILFAVINDLSYDQRMIRICSSLSDAGYQVTLIGRKLSTSIPLQDLSFQQKRMHLFFKKGPLFYLEYNIRLFFHLLGNQYDIFGACDLDTALAIHFAGRLRGKKRILDAHEYFTEVPEVMARPLVKRIWKFIGNMTVPHFHLRYTVNSALAMKLEEVYGVPFEVVRNMPVCQNIIPADSKNSDVLNQNRHIILYQGALNAGRGLEEMIKAMPSIDGAQLWLVGEGDLRSLLRRLATEFNVADRVLFKGKVTPDNLRQITPKATIGLNLLNGSSLNYYYSLANKFFDYMHAGVPSVNMNFPAYQTILKEHKVGICLNNLEPAMIAQEIKELLSDPSTMEQMRKNCHKASPHFCWQNEQLHLTHIVSDIL